MILFIFILLYNHYCQMNEITCIIKSHAQYGIMNYTSNLYCEYIIKAPMNYKIIIQIEELDLEETNSCIFDYLLITDEYYTNVYTYCGHQVKASHSIEMNSSQVYIIFGTDDANHGHGFLLKYETVKNEALKSNKFYSCGLTFQLNEDVEYNDNKMESRIIGGELSRPDSPISNELRHLYIPLLNLTVCNQTGAYQGKLTETMICAGYIRGGKDSCQGDSGSPLMCQLHNTTDHVWYQIGIVSFGKSCAAAGTPGIYSNLTFVNNWISSIIQSYE
ncbi:uncharacterized protein DC041_0004564 [Schistosoma bovis]|uniref:CUB domain-containing protein n=1 Tax=Schistosoma bovis TaxID=6184 RepID=A0A430Q984_SCHBO|nr:uncharacterized protein DC041_0004564 [Schistosoma bovis]